MGAYATAQRRAPKVYEKYIKSPLDEPITSNIDHVEFRFSCSDSLSFQALLTMSRNSDIGADASLATRLRV
jgi:hypothetical protein